MKTTLAIVVLSAAAGFGAAWQLQAHQITKLKLEHTNERISVARANRIVVERATLKLAKAQENYASATERSRRERADANDFVAGLHDATAAAVRDAGTSAEACNRQVASFAVVFDQCSGAVVDMAEHAQDWYIEAMRQHEAP